MRELLKADFRRVIKDKLLIVMGILALVFAVITPALYAVIMGFVGTEDPIVGEMLATSFSAKGMFFNAFLIGDNLGLVAPVLLAIVLWKDFSYGTVRNKIISGKSRHAIFFSMFCVSSVVLIATMLFHAFATLGFSLIFFEYQADPFVAADFWYLIESVLFEILVLLTVSAILSWLCAVMKNLGLVIVMYVAISFLLVMASGIITVIVMVLETMEGNELAIEILNVVNRINFSANSSYIGQGTKYALEDVFYLTIPALVTTVSLIAHALYCFHRKDLK